MTAALLALTLSFTPTYPHNYRSTPRITVFDVTRRVGERFADAYCSVPVGGGRLGLWPGKDREDKLSWGLRWRRKF